MGWGRGTWDATIRGLWDVGLGDAGTWDSGTPGRGTWDSGTLGGLRDAGTRGRGDSGLENVETRGRDKETTHDFFGALEKGK